MSRSITGGQEKDVWGVIKAWNAAYEAGDADKFFSHFDENADFFTMTSATRVDDLSNFRSIFEGSLKSKVKRKSVLLSPEVKVFGDTAIATQHARISIGGVTQSVRQTQVLRKADGGWKIIHLHVSPVEIKAVKPDDFLAIHELESRIAVAAAAVGTPK